MKDYTKLIFWQRSHELVKKIYSLTEKFPKTEIYELTSQIRRAVLSVPTNIAEGCGRTSKRELRQFLIIASGSLTEVEYLLFLSQELNYTSLADFQLLDKEIKELKKMLTAYKNKLE